MGRLQLVTFGGISISPTRTTVPGKQSRETFVGTGGYMRSASSRQASMLGSFAAAVIKLSSSSDLKASRTSSVTLLRAFGDSRSQYVTPESSVAVFLRAGDDKDEVIRGEFVITQPLLLAPMLEHRVHKITTTM